MNWIDRLREWDYNMGDIMTWFLNIVEFHVQRIGWPAYVGITMVILAIGLAFPPTRQLTGNLIAGVFRSFLMYFQIVLSLITVQLFGFVARFLLAQFHRTRRWVGSMFSGNNSG
jgi:Na+/serine symporter